MRVVKVEAEGPTTSFRYPFFMVGRQPTKGPPRKLGQFAQPAQRTEAERAGGMCG